jgi:hypothetical protein
MSGAWNSITWGYMQLNNFKARLEAHLRWVLGEPGGVRLDLRGANLIQADLSGANLMEANLDFASWPLSCGSKAVIVDARIASQMAAHFCALQCDGDEYKAAKSALLGFARKSHMARELGLADGSDLEEAEVSKPRPG